MAAARRDARPQNRETFALLDWSVTLPVFLTAAVEWVEAFTVVLAVSLTIGWRGATAAAGAALLTLVVLAAVTGGVLDLGARVADLQLVIGILLLLFGMRWLAKAIARQAGLKSLRDEAAEFASTTAVLSGADRAAAWVVAFKGVLLEGLEVWLVVVALGGAGGSWGSAAGGAVAALLAVAALGLWIRAPLTRVPENLIKLCVGAMIVAFGTFWTMEAVGGPGTWPAGDWSLLALAVFYLAGAAGLSRLVRRSVTEATS